MGATKRTLATRVGMIVAASLLVLPAFVGTASAAPAASPTDACSQLSSQLTTVLGQISSLSGQTGALSGTPLDTLLSQIATLQSTANGLSSQLSALCSALPSTGTGTGSVTEQSLSNGDYGDYSTPTTYNYNHYTYDYNQYDTTAPVVSTQVASVPRGGVNTGDGSFGE